MPGMFEKRLNYCNGQLDKLFQGLILSKELNIQLQAIKIHYHSMILNAGAHGERVIKMYEFLINTLHQARNKTITLSEAIRRVEQKAAARENEIFWNNGFNGLSLALLFLLATAAYLSLYVLVASCFPIQPIIGFAVLVLASELFIEQLNRILSPYIDFEVSAPIKDECKREVSVMSFFRSNPIELASQSFNVESPLVEVSF
ncbi:DUF5638 domain-containing protein [Legionella rowbothamii]|uniref:DUF5638 domain-containing protein n=1 Tax=Legionella rowbothamii TaxID=96229 RepID=UPI001055FC02|nr:DUF5638 domain-containing protein [Legionella rowbothamii]